MGDPIHGHEVIKMMINSPAPFTPESLEKAILQKFGAEARFYTCSAENMTAKELISFLNQRDKFIKKGDDVSIDTSKVCDHESEEG
ncbi:metal-binding protein [bacterium F11]|nr:metal-binding protein [bacterium F11]